MYHGIKIILLLAITGCLLVVGQARKQHIQLAQARDFYNEEVERLIAAGEVCVTQVISEPSYVKITSHWRPVRYHNQVTGRWDTYCDPVDKPVGAEGEMGMLAR